MLDLKEIKLAINFMAKEKNIDKEKIVDIIEAAIKTAYKKDYGNKDEEVNVKLDLENETLEVSVQKTVVKEVTNPALEISFDELGDDAENFSEGDIVELDVTDEIQNGKIGDSFGRIASQAARQVIIQKIGDTEKEKIFELFEGKQGQIINVKIELVEGNKVIFDYQGHHVTLPKGEQVSKDNYVAGARFYLYVDEVSRNEAGVSKVVLTRKKAELVSAIFKENVPEIDEGLIKIDAIVRHAGIKTKILVSSNFDEIDPVGTLIGQKGIRVKAVMDELSGEKIDIIPNSEDKTLVIKKALSPADVIKVEIDEENQKANAYILVSQRAKAVGKNGINVNLAAKLTGYKISIIDVEDDSSEKKD
ncbi:transcription termination factor NusA [Candidatus Gracilibacteria bacterium GN02-872]|nr:transcription termination factor NusA [Candidatus Gracilibacteria bacterium GN02-872]RKW22647.1 MAG: transcription termination factor NusA [Candidatus Gracilibacteria bacterium]